MEGMDTANNLEVMVDMGMAPVDWPVLGWATELVHSPLGLELVCTVAVITILCRRSSMVTRRSRRSHMAWLTWYNFMKINSPKLRRTSKTSATLSIWVVVDLWLARMNI